MSATFSVLLCCIFLQNSILAFQCNQILSDTEIKFLNWMKLEECIIEIGRNPVDKNASENIWQLIKTANGGVENIAPLVYKNMGNLITGIPLDDLRNITFDVVEKVKAFGSIRDGFSDEQMALIAQKVYTEWPNKKSETYSEYDLISMGQIVCYLNLTDVASIHAVAFRFAAEWIGNLNNCPADRIQAFARLAVQKDAFGPPLNWSTLDVSTMGNIIKGLRPFEIESIKKEKLRFNKYFRIESGGSNTVNNSSNISMKNETS